ncbi:hypothetical protein LSH36_10g04008 [Paralvinella palmiformis]|uniref:Uncharacterized protein n=1 Tax=Paralvinella palmiformis TaxID=53620 RepID=A0AAD9KDP5_9ANNE|nr:hypothetical protein LSH36_10g04008 [Paralvinella palmiformis]
MAAAFNADRDNSIVPAVYRVVRPRNPCTTPVKRPCLSLQVVEPLLFPPISKKVKTRHVNEKLQGYVHSPRDPEPLVSETRLPPLQETKTIRQRSRKKMACSVPRYERPNAFKGHPDRMAIPDDILPPLKFHSSLHNRTPFLKRTSRCPRWLFHDPEVKTTHFKDDTFRIFRPMLYSVLMTQRIMPRIRLSREDGDDRRPTGRSGCTDSPQRRDTSSPKTSTEGSTKASSGSGSSERRNERSTSGDTMHISKEISQSEIDKRSGSADDLDIDDAAL